MDEAGDRMDHATWPERALILAALGAFCGYLSTTIQQGARANCSRRNLRGAAIAFKARLCC
jgi:hypothetical protein